jgi:hypothetical protein
MEGIQNQRGGLDFQWQRAGEENEWRLDAARQDGARARRVILLAALGLLALLAAVPLYLRLLGI